MNLLKGGLTFVEVVVFEKEKVKKDGNVSSSKQYCYLILWEFCSSNLQFPSHSLYLKRLQTYNY